LPFLIIYTISLWLFKIMKRGDLELLSELLPHHLKKILNMFEGFINYGTPP